MTKEELEKEAINRVDAFIDTLSQDIRSTLHDRLNQEDIKDFLYGVYIDSAEPREKRIAELEEENAFLRRQFDRIVNDIKDCVNPDARYNVDDLINEWDIELENQDKNA